MKSLKMSGPVRLLAFVLIAVILIFVITIAVGGKQSNPENEPDSGDVGQSTDQTDENKDGQTNQDQSDDQNKAPDDSTEEAPKFYSVATGLEITEEEFNTSPLAFLVDSASPLYGISNADITIEIPLENGKTRFLVLGSNYNSLWKIGSLAPARDFISSLASLYGGTLISYGNDDIIEYDTENHSDNTYNLANASGAYNVENAKYVYTSIEKVTEALNKSKFPIDDSYAAMPYIFADSKLGGTASADIITLPYSESSETSLYYSESKGVYTLYKASQKSTDKLTGSDICYKNAFVLFANSTTYETSDGKELVIDTYKGGTGYYATNGRMTEIIWEINDDGNLIFKTLSGDALSINKGNSYIAYYKTSVSSEVTFK